MSNFKNLKTGSKITCPVNGERTDSGELRNNELLHSKLYGGVGNTPGARIGVDEIVSNGVRPYTK